MPQVTVRAFGKPKQGVQVSTVEAAPDTTLEVFLAGLAEGAAPGQAFAGQAILLNGQSVARKDWSTRLLEQGDVVAIIPMLIGG